MLKYIFAAFVVPKSRLDPVSCTLLKTSRDRHVIPRPGIPGGIDEPRIQSRQHVGLDLPAGIAPASTSWPLSRLMACATISIWPSSAARIRCQGCLAGSGVLGLLLYSFF